MMNQPLVSIVTPSLNSSRFIEETIQSVKQQTYKNIEHIIVDGGSADNTIEIVKQYPHIILIAEPDNGMYDAINKGLRRAQGEIVAYLNSDDLYYPETIQIAVSYLMQHPDVSLVYGDCDFIDVNGNYLYTYRYPKFQLRRFVCLKWSSIPQQTTFWRRQIHNLVGYFDTSFRLAGDFEFYARVGQKLRIDHISVKAISRLHSQSLLRSYPQQEQKEVARIHNMYGVDDSILTGIRRYIYAASIRLPNSYLMLKKAFYRLAGKQLG
jgi:glycosyltransferase involved in cell wall biosynthesis